MEKKAVFTFNVIDKHGEKTTCNIVEPLDATLGRIEERIENINQTYDLVGNITLQFVVEDNTGYIIKKHGKLHPVATREFDESIIY